MSDESQLYEWTPLKGIGGIVLGLGLGELESKLQLSRIPKEDMESVGWETWGNQQDTLRIYLEDGMICSISCYKECWYRGHNVIGMPLLEALELLRIKELPQYEVADMPEGPQNIFDLDSVGAQLWVEEDKVVAVCIF